MKNTKWNLYIEGQTSAKPFITIGRMFAPRITQNLVVEVGGVKTKYIVRDWSSVQVHEYNVTVSVPDPERSCSQEFTPPNSTKASRYGI